MTVIAGPCPASPHTWRDDFPKYAARRDLTRMLRVFHFAACNQERKVKYSNVSPDDQSATVRRDSRRLGDRLRDFQRYPQSVFRVAAPGRCEREGLRGACSGCRPDSTIICSGWDGRRSRSRPRPTGQCGAGGRAVHRTALAVPPRRAAEPGADLLAARRPIEQRGSRLRAEFGGCIVPIEVKAGRAGTLKSLHQFVFEKRVPFAIRFHAELPELQEVDTEVRRGRRHWAGTVPTALSAALPGGAAAPNRRRVVRRGLRPASDLPVRPAFPARHRKDLLRSGRRMPWFSTRL